MNILRRGLWCLLFWVCGSVALAALPVPPLNARVTDLTGTLDAAQRGALEDSLKNLEARKGAQVAVLMLPTTQPETIEQYAVRVMETWKLGRRGVDDGVLLLVARDDRRVRIEVGYGLEGALPDAGAKRIISEDITPRFKAGDYFGGLRAGVDRIARVIEGEPLPPLPATPAGNAAQVWDFASSFFWPLLLLAFLLCGVFRSLFGRLPGALIAALLLGGVIWIFVFWFAGLIAGLIAFILTLAGDVMFVGRGGTWHGGGGGGGFSGGGGTSGGGGASGSW